MGAMTPLTMIRSGGLLLVEHDTIYIYIYMVLYCIDA